MWSSLDERIDRYERPNQTATEYTLNEMRQLFGAILLFYGLPILIIAVYPKLVFFFGEFTSFFVHGWLYREAVFPSLSGLFFDGLIVYLALFLAYPKRTLTKDRTLRMYHQVIQALASRSLPSLSATDAVTWRLYLMKLFFLPLMLSFWFTVSADLLYRTEVISTFFYSGLSSALAVILLGSAFLFFVDVSCFVLGYMTESKRLDNVVISVDPTVSGWLVCLMCYPPFNVMTAGILGSLYEVGASFGPPLMWLTLTLVGLGLLTIYALASVNLFGKASNLTYRGLVTTGTYGIVRHPAYASKVGSWVLITSPFVLANPWLVVAIVGWAVIYALRALTEERHIKMVAPVEYAAYEQKVPWRFIPYLI